MVIYGGTRVHIIRSGARFLILHGCTRVLVSHGGPCNPVIVGDWGQPQGGACAGEQREVRQALRAGIGPVLLQRCCLCGVNRNCLVGLRDHKVSRRHQFMINRAKMIPCCTSCDRLFETVRDPGRYERGQLHTRVVASCS
ncbi:hypothetical protein BU14_0071s0049 [Porphyra umbilicalis]|uniref:Uncharacterized protein n=1 Tax=Porphyra umbilicalis TaxID=2786 RepID=A0A1X6PGB5_PORUM|nr:hypothetical protein BU14_0071s0049 [Porphyra umbilicalis]|eukprot:OSX79795.1 hypothetical protein BU14_0071s0049 [Porphyra umbilicalis]